jgi:hypothetical protein
MQAKILEIRDSATYFAVVCVDMNPDMDLIDVVAEKPSDRVRERADRYDAQRYHLRRRGFPCDGVPNIAIHHINCGGEAVWNDPYGWSRDTRTYRVAHEYIYDHWAELKDGDVVDVEFILGETTEKKTSERISDPL